MTCSGLLERASPYLAGLIAGFVGYCWLGQNDPPETSAQVYSASVELGGVLVGFVMTAKSILLALGDRQYIQEMKRNGALGTLLFYMFDAAIGALVLVLLSVVLLTADCKHPDEWRRFAIALWLATGTFSWMAILRLVWLFFRTLKRVA